MTNPSDPNYNIQQSATALKEPSKSIKSRKSEQSVAPRTVTNDSTTQAPQAAIDVLVKNNSANNSQEVFKSPSLSNVKKTAINQTPSTNEQLFFQGTQEWKQLGLEDFIVRFNKSRGDQEMKDWAFQKLEEMEHKGGIGNSPQKEMLDIAAARLGLIDLTAIANQEIKFRALKGLQEIIKNDPISKEYYEGLLEAMSSLQEKMNADFQQHQLVELQIEFAKTYGAMAELILRHYAADLSNGITEELKGKFKAAIESLKMLNRHDDPCLSYYAKFALEGIMRLKDDRQELIGIFGGFYHFILAGTAVYFEDGQALEKELALIFNDIKINIKHSWYEKSIRIREMSKYASKDIHSLENMLQAIEANRKLGWNFLYTSIEALTDIAINGATKQIRKAALRGSNLEDKNQTKLPGLLAYINYSRIPRRFKLNSKLSLRKPKVKDPNAYIRLTCLQNLIKISMLAPDVSVRKNARSSIIHSINFDKDPLVKKYLLKMATVEKCIPNKPELYTDWIQEKGTYAPHSICNAGTSNSDIEFKSAEDFSFESHSPTHSSDTKKTVSSKIIQRSSQSLSALDVIPGRTTIPKEKRRSLQSPLENHSFSLAHSDSIQKNPKSPLIINIAENTFDSLPDSSLEATLNSPHIDHLTPPNPPNELPSLAKTLSKVAIKAMPNED